MANRWVTSGIIIFALFLISGISRAEGDYPSYYQQPEGPPPDTTKADTLTAGAPEDSLGVPFKFVKENQDTAKQAVIDTSQILQLPQPLPYKPYFKTYISMRSYGDYFRNIPGIYSLQDGAIGQAEMLTKSVMLPGLSATYNGFPVFYQGFYVPFRAGLDLDILPYDNVSEFKLTSLANLGLFSQGEELSLRSSSWPSDSNLSSITVAQGAYDFKKTAWRFSRRFSPRLGVTFSAGFKKSSGFYASGADYSNFNVLGSFAWRPTPNSQVIYNFYQQKTKQGLIQFDRLVPPTLRSRNNQDMHMVRSSYLASENWLWTADIFYQNNYNHVFENSGENFDFIYKDYIWAGALGNRYSSGKHNFNLEIGGKRHFIRDISSQKSVTIGALAGDSLVFNDEQAFIIKGRLTHNNFEDWKLSAGARFDQLVGEDSKLWLSAGVLHNDPDIYAMFLDLPTLVPSDQNVIASYSYVANPDLKARSDRFFEIGFAVADSQMFRPDIKVTFEDVKHDLFPSIAVADSVNWSSTQHNVDYKRLTVAAGLDYSITQFFKGSTGLTYFYYNPSRLLPQVKYSPNFLAYSRGELIVKGVLREIDLSGAFQLRYLSDRYYYGFVSLVSDQYHYKRALVLDGSLAFRFGTFDFRLTEDNILDFFYDNKYTTWGEYSMTPGSIWWTFTWNFRN